MPESISFKTKDNVIIHGTYCAVDAEKGGIVPKRGVVLLHMMPATKESWSSFSPQLTSRGFHVLGIDLRGHGESLETESGEKLDYKLFTDEDHMAKIHDVNAAVEWLMDKTGISLNNIGLVGASIGANLSIAYAGAHPEIPVAAALSPGLDYHGVTTVDKVKAMRPEQKLYLAASSEDEGSFTASKKLSEVKPDSVLKEFHDSGHGTSLFEAHSNFMVELAEWLDENIPKKEDLLKA